MTWTTEAQPFGANHVPLITALSSVDGITPVPIAADPTTGGLLISGGGAGTQYAEGATTSPGTGTLAIGRYTTVAPSLSNGELYGLQLDSSGNLKVTGSLSVGGTTDNSAFTAGTSTGTPAMGFYHSTIDTVTDGRSAAVGITSKRAMLVNLQNASGTEIGTSSTPVQVSLANTGSNSNALLVNGTGGTFPVSGTIAATQSGTWTVGLSAGSNLVGKVGIDQTSIGSTNNVSVSGSTGAGTSVLIKDDTAFGDGVTSGILSTTSRLWNGTNYDRWKGDTTNGAYVNVKTSVLPTGAATAAKQPALGAAGTASTDVITVQGIASMTALKVDGSAVTQPVSIAAPTTIFNGKTTVTTAGTRVTLAASQAVRSVTIKALPTNTGIIYVGNSSVASTNGLQLSASESVSMDISNLNTVNLDSSVNGEGVTYLGVS